jgi:hypothetical protein
MCKFNAGLTTNRMEELHSFNWFHFAGFLSFSFIVFKGRERFDLCKVDQIFEKIKLH